MVDKLTQSDQKRLTNVLENWVKVESDDKKWFKMVQKDQNMSKKVAVRKKHVKNGHKMKENPRFVSTP